MAYSACLIGVNEYLDTQFQKLNCVINDIEVMQQVLFISQCQYEIMTITNKNATSYNITKKLNYFFDCDDDDTLFLYWSGHGEFDKFITYETNSSDMINTSIEMKSIANMIQESNAKAIVAVFDTCFSGAIARSGAQLMLNIEGNGKVIMASSDYCEKSFEYHNTGHGMFTSCFLRGLQGEAANLTGIITVGGLHDYICENINVGKTKNLQTPVTNAVMVGSIVLNKVIPNQQIINNQSQYQFIKENNLISRNSITEGTPLEFSNLAQVIMTNKKIKDFNVFICKRPNTEMSVHSDENVKFFLKRLNWVGIFTIETLIEKLELYYDFIKFLATQMYDSQKLKPTLTQTPPGIAIYYLCYSLLFYEQSVDKIISFLEIDGYKTTYDDKSNVAKYLNSYNQFYLSDIETRTDNKKIPFEIIGEFVVIYYSASSNREEKIIYSKLVFNESGEAILYNNIEYKGSSSSEYLYQGYCEDTENILYVYLKNEHSKEQATMKLIKPVGNLERYIGLLTACTANNIPVCVKIACYKKHLEAKIDNDKLLKSLSQKNEQYTQKAFIIEDNAKTIFYSDDIFK